MEEEACLADSRTRTTLGKENNVQIRWEERERRKKIDFLQSEGAWPRNYKPENKKTLITFLKCIFQSICHFNSSNIFILNCFSFLGDLVFKMLISD